MRRRRRLCAAEGHKSFRTRKKQLCFAISLCTVNTSSPTLLVSILSHTTVLTTVTLVAINKTRLCNYFLLVTC